MSNQVDAAAVAVEVIQNTASLVEMNQHKWGTEKTDVAVGQEVKLSKAATGRAVKVRVNLANGWEHELRSLTRVMSRAYHYHLRSTMPWGDGLRLLSNTQLIDYLGAMQGFKSELDAAKATLLPKLPTLVNAAVHRNGALGSSRDYPSKWDDITDAFSFDFDFTPVPDSSGFSGLPDGFRETFEDKYTNRVQQRMAEGVADLYGRLGKILSEFRGTLVKEKPKFFQSTLDNITQLSLTLQSMNVTGNSDISAITDALSNVMGYSITQLKNTQTARDIVVSYIDGILLAFGQDPAPEAPALSTLDDLITDTEEDDGYIKLPDSPADLPAPKFVSSIETPTTETPAEQDEVETVDDDIASLFSNI